MGIIKKVQKQDAVYWPPIGANPDGSKKYGSPVPIRCRWTPGTVQLVTPSGENVTVNTYLITSILLAVGGRVVLGKVRAMPYPSDPEKCGAVEVQSVKHTPNIRQTKHLYEAWA